MKSKGEINQETTPSCTRPLPLSQVLTPDPPLLPSSRPAEVDEGGGASAEDARGGAAASQRAQMSRRDVLAAV